MVAQMSGGVAVMRCVCQSRSDRHSQHSSDEAAAVAGVDEGAAFHHCQC